MNILKSAIAVLLSVLIFSMMGVEVVAEILGAAAIQAILLSRKALFGRPRPSDGIRLHRVSALS